MPLQWTYAVVCDAPACDAQEDLIRVADYDPRQRMPDPWIPPGWTWCYTQKAGGDARAEIYCPAHFPVTS